MSRRQHRIAHLSAAEQGRVLTYIGDLRDFFALGDVQIILMKEPAEKWADNEDVNAGVHLSPLRYAWSFNLYVCSDWASLSKAQRRGTLVHEFTHCIHSQVDWVIEDWVLGNSRTFSETDRDVARDDYHYAVERMVDRTARMLTRWAPPYPDTARVPAHGVVVEDEHL